MCNFKTAYLEQIGELYTKSIPASIAWLSRINQICLYITRQVPTGGRGVRYESELWPFPNPIPSRSLSLISPIYIQLFIAHLTEAKKKSLAGNTCKYVCVCSRALHEYRLLDYINKKKMKIQLYASYLYPVPLPVLLLQRPRAKSCT